MAKRVQTCVRLPRELNDRMGSVARELGIAVNAWVVNAIERALAADEKAIAAPTRNVMTEFTTIGTNVTAECRPRGARNA
jgi:predicted DNA-binding protein